MDIESKLKSYLDEQLVEDQGEGLSVEQPLLDSGIIDSTAIFELIDFIEASFAVSIPDEEVVPENFESIKAIASFVEGKLNQ